MSLGGRVVHRPRRAGPRAGARPRRSSTSRRASTAEKAAPITNFVNGPASFASFDELLARTIEHNPGRSESSLRRGILHNAVQREDGSWVWRYARFRDEPSEAVHPEFGDWWEAVSGLRVPLLLVRGLAWSVVGDEDVAELLRRQPEARRGGRRGRRPQHPG